MHSAKTIKWVMRLPLYIGLGRKIRIESVNPMKADIPLKPPVTASNIQEKTMTRSSIDASVISCSAAKKLNVYERAKSGHSRIFMLN